MKKGRHRRFEEGAQPEARNRGNCGAVSRVRGRPEEEHASWCLYESEELDEPEEVVGFRPSSYFATPEVEGKSNGRVRPG